MRKIKKRTNVLAALVLSISLLTVLALLSYQNLIKASGNNIDIDACVTPSGYVELDEAISNYVNGNKSSVNTFATLTRIDKVGSSTNCNVYLQRINPISRKRSGIYIYNSKGFDTYTVGNIVGFTGLISEYNSGYQIKSPTNITLLSNSNSYGDVEPLLISNGSQIASLDKTYDQSILVKYSGVKINNKNETTSLSSNTSKIIFSDTTISGTISPLMVDSATKEITLSIKDKLNSYVDSDKTLDIIGNIKNDNGTLYLSIGSLSSISEHKTDDEQETCKTFDIYALNDTHGVVKDTSTSAGIEKTSTYLKNKMKENKNSFVLSSGDMWQGSMYSNNTKGLLMSEWMNEINVKSMTFGNHEFDWGNEAILNNKDKANFPFLGINIFDKNTNQRVDYADASTTFTIDEVKFGIIGAIGDCYSSISGSKVKDIYFKINDELSTLVINEAKRLKETEKCDFIIYSLHDNYEGCDTSITASGYIDLVFEAHTHTNYVTTDENGIYHIQGGGYNSYLSHATVSIDKTTNEKSINPETIATSSFLDLSNDNETTAIINSYMDVIGNPDEVVGYNSTYLSSASLSDLVASLYLSKGESLWSTYNLILGGGYIVSRTPYNLAKGNITIETLYNLYPFDNNLELCSASGAFLKANYTTNSSTYHVTYKSSLDSLNNTKTYYFVTDTYGSDYYIYGNGKNKTGASTFNVIDSKEIYARDLLKEYIADGNLAN